MSLIPRLDMETLRADVAEALEPRVRRLGYLGEFFRVAGHQPDALRDFIGYTDSAKAGLEKKFVEVIALTAAGRIGNAYERNQHERLSVRLGFGRDWVQAVNALDPEAAGDLLTPEERVTQSFVLEALKGEGTLGAPRILPSLVEAIGHEGAVAVMFVLGRYLIHGLFVNTLELAPPVPSIFEDGFKG